MNSVAEFFYMGGYALYVWGSFGVTALMMVAEPIILKQRRVATEKRMKRIARSHVRQQQ